MPGTLLVFVFFFFFFLPGVPHPQYSRIIVRMAIFWGRKTWWINNGRCQALFDCVCSWNPISLALPMNVHSFYTPACELQWGARAAVLGRRVSISRAALSPIRALPSGLLVWPANAMAVWPDGNKPLSSLKPFTCSVPWLIAKGLLFKCAFHMGYVFCYPFQLQSWLAFSFKQSGVCSGFFLIAKRVWNGPDRKNLSASNNSHFLLSGFVTYYSLGRVIISAQQLALPHQPCCFLSAKRDIYSSHVINREVIKSASDDDSGKVPMVSVPTACSSLQALGLVPAAVRRPRGRKVAALHLLSSAAFGGEKRFFCSSLVQKALPSHWRLSCW